MNTQKKIGKNSDVIFVTAYWWCWWERPSFDRRWGQCRKGRDTFQVVRRSWNWGIRFSKQLRDSRGRCTCSALVNDYIRRYFISVSINWTIKKLPILPKNKFNYNQTWVKDHHRISTTCHKCQYFKVARVAIVNRFVYELGKTIPTLALAAIST